MSRSLFAIVPVWGLLAMGMACRALERGPTDADVIAEIKRAPPAPPTLGPTYLASVDLVEVRERGRYRQDGGYWSFRVRVKGGARIKITNPFQVGLVDASAREKAEAVDFAEEAHFTKDDFGSWRVSYAYDPNGPRWRTETPSTRESPR